jgi:hypothetical protein
MVLYFMKHKPLRVTAFKADGIWGQRYGLSKQLQDLYIDVALLSETYLKTHESFCIPNYKFHRTDRFPGRKGGSALAVRKGIPHTCVILLQSESDSYFTTGSLLPISSSWCQAS